MSTEDLSHMLDGRKQFEMLLELLINNLACTQALIQVMASQGSGGNDDKFAELMKEFKDVSETARSSLKDQLFAKYGHLPPEILEPED